jgi:hypothetical protein
VSVSSQSRVLAGLFAALFSMSGVALGQNHYPLELTNIKPQGTGGQTANHRIYRAYPGLEYNIRAAVIGGAYPYVFSLANAPAGMTVDGRGVIEWPNPQGEATPTLTVRDSAGNQVQAAWTIRAATAGFRFVDATNGNDAADGTRAAPWRTLGKVHSSGAANEIVYFRAGTYTLAGIPVSAADSPVGEEYVSWDAKNRPVIWLAHPGDARPIVDFGYTGKGQPYDRGDSVPRIKISGANIYIDGMTFFRSMTMAFQVYHANQAGTTFRRNVFDTTGPGIDGGNSAFIMFVASGRANGLYTVVQDNEFKNLKRGSAHSGLKLYTLTKPLFEDNSFHDFENYAEGLAVKSAIVQYTIRGNTFFNVGQGIVGNMDDYSGQDNTRGEVLFNNIRVTGGEPIFAMHLNQNGTAGETFIYRNTFIGPVVVFNADAGDGPFRFTNNVIVSPDSGAKGSRISHSEVSDGTRVIAADNLVGSPSDRIVGPDGRLLGAHRTKFIGRRGHETGAPAAAPPR